MANSKISALTSATTPLAGTETLPVVQSSTTKQVSVANLTAGRAVSAASLALTSSPLPVTSGGTGLTAVTATQILFGYTAGAFSASSNFVYDYTNIRVGIGTSSPWSQASILTPTGGTEGYFGVKDTTYGGDIRFGKASGANNNGVAGTWTNNDFLIYSNTVNTFTFNTAGNLVVNTSGKGIDFSATPGTGTSELFADYEEGTWTPVDGSGAGLVLTVASASYTKVGRLVEASFAITFPATASAAAIRLGGLPFTSKTFGASMNTVSFSVVQYAIPITGVVDSNATTFLPLTYGAGTITNASMSGLILRGTAIYEV